MYEYSICINPTNRGQDQPIPSPAAQYLFIDTIPRTTINANGLYDRVFVFTKFGLPKIEQVV